MVSTTKHVRSDDDINDSDIPIPNTIHIIVVLDSL